MSNKQKVMIEPGIIAYLRVSTDEQAVSGLGTEAQRKAIEAEASQRGVPILEWHEDLGVSGKSLKRPGLIAALADLDRGHGSMLMVSKLDRLSRSVHDATGVMKTAERGGWALVALDVSIDTSTPQGGALLQILSVFAELERRLIGQRTKDALAVKKAHGGTLGRPRVIDEELAHRIREDHSTGSSWSAIARKLNADGVPTARGGVWYPATVRLIAQRDDERSSHLK